MNNFGYTIKLVCINLNKKTSHKVVTGLNLYVLSLASVSD